MSNVYVQKAPLGDAAKIQRAVEELLAGLPAFGRIGPDTKVVLKPNLLAKHVPEKAVTTHPEVLRAVIRCVQARGATRITVAESPGGPHTAANLRGIYKASGLAAVCEQAGVDIWYGTDSVAVPSKGSLVRQFNLLAPVVEADFIINLPKMKTHVLTGMTGAVKNLFGCVPGLQKAEFHTRFPEKPHFGEMMVDLCETVGADIHLVDGLLAMEGDGPGSGSPRRCDLLFAAENPYLLDLALCRAMGMEAMGTPILAAAHRRGLCPAVLPEEALVGTDEAKAPIPNYLPPQSYSERVDFSGNVPGFLRPLATRMVRAAAPRPIIRKKRCIGCAKCAGICPQNTIDMQSGKAEIRYQNCIKCFCCHEICPVHAVDVRRTGIFRL